MDLIRYIGKFLISVGVGVLLFVIWTLKGTDIYAARQQERLADEYARLPQVEIAAGGEASFEPPVDLAREAGDPVFRLRIPEIDVDEIVVQGVDREALKKGPGFYPECGPGFPKPLCLEDAFYPGESGTSVISGHRTTYGAPFWGLDRLDAGDEIVVETKWGLFTYRVTKSEIVESDAGLVVAAGKKRLLLTTCHPKYSAAERLLVWAELVETEQA